MLRDALNHTGYNQEEAYFHRENRKLLVRLKEQKLKQKTQESSKASTKKEVPQNKAA